MKNIKTYIHGIPVYFGEFSFIEFYKKYLQTKPRDENKITIITHDLMMKRNIVADYLLSKLSESQIEDIGRMLLSKECRITGDLIVNYEDGLPYCRIVSINASKVWTGSNIVPKVPNSPYIDE